MYLKDMAILWWRRLQAERQRGNPNATVMNTWDAFKGELKRYFYPGDATFQARSSLKTLKHTGSIRIYIKIYTDLVLQVPDMSEENLLFNLVSNLSP